MRRTWIKIFCDPWLRGSIRKEDPMTRAIFTDLLTMAGDSAFGDNGIIQLAEGVGLSDEAIAAILNVPLSSWLSAKERLSNHPDSKENRIEIILLSQGFAIKIINWKRYQSEYKRQKFYRDRKKEKRSLTLSKKEKNHIDIEEDIEGEQFVTKVTKKVTRQVIDYFNEVTGQKRGYQCKETNDFISGRLSEGRTFDDFKHVIDTKTAKWKGQSWIDSRTDKIVYGDDFLRPSTLFRPGNFEDYLNEPYADPKRILPPKPGETRKEDGLPINYKLWQEIASILIDRGIKESDLMRFHGKLKSVYPKIETEWKTSSQTAQELIRLIERQGE